MLEEDEASVRHDSLVLLLLDVTLATVDDEEFVEDELLFVLDEEVDEWLLELLVSD